MEQIKTGSPEPGFFYLWMDNNSASSRIISNTSGFTVKSDSDLAPVNDYRHQALTVGILQHFLHFVSIKSNVTIFNLPAFFGASFTSCDGMGSGVFAVN